MLQFMQNSSGMNGEKQSITNAENEDPLAQADTLKVVSCPVCHAVYIPSSRQQTVVRGPETLLESAFLTVCHFCFRCQRPACPQCWNPIHHVCASCSEEALLPFRSPVPSLEGLIFSSQTSSQEPALSFTCLRDGNFYVPASPSRAEPPANHQADSLSSSSYPVTAKDLPALHTDQRASSPAPSYPGRRREVMSPQRDEPNSQPFTSASRQRENDPPIWPDQVGSLPSSPHMSRPDGQPVVPPALPPMPALPSTAAHPQMETGQIQDDEEEDISLFEHIENVLIIVISALLLAILLMIVLALSSADLNRFFFHLLHIDIRTEILYLLQLR